MCGIVGYVTSKPSYKHATIIQQGLFVDSLRGMCGTGIYAADLKDNRAYQFKRALTGPDFINSDPFARFKKQSDSFQVVIGHNRAATLGEAKDENCHPFLYGDVGFVHNGTLRGYRSLVTDKSFEHGVDSAWAAKAISENDDPVKVLEQVDGPYVFVWHNMRTQTFNIARNSNRDIWYVLDKDNNSLYFASEYEMLNWILERNGVDIGNNKYRSPAEHSLVTFDLTKPFTKAPKVIKYEEYQPPKYEYKGRDWTGHGSYNWHDKLLEDVELERDEEILIKITGWQKYNEYQVDQVNPRGTLFGVIEEPKTKHDGLECKVHGVQKDQAETFLADGWAVACVTGITNVWEKGVETKIVNANCPQLPKRSKLALPAPKVDDDTDVEPLYLGPHGVYITRGEFLVLADMGCVRCGNPVIPEEAEEISWVEWAGVDEHPVCKTCSEDDNCQTELQGWGAIFIEPKRGTAH